ncbi:MAG: phycobilisome linker polypeptide [Cyanobacteria bacterium P01_A01_bin.123]
MLGQYSTSGVSGLENRIFVYEVAGLRQNEVTVSHQSPIRTSDNQSIQVPFHRMNEVMRSITLLGGKIVNIRPLNAPEVASTTSP